MVAVGDHGALHPYVEFLFDADPVLAGAHGDDRRAESLGSVDPDALSEVAERRRAWLDATTAEPEPAVGTVEWLDREALLLELRGAVARDEFVRPWQRALNCYPERIGQALSGAMTLTDPDRAARALLGRLREIPGHLGDARRNLVSDPPAQWAQMAVGSCDGLGRFLRSAVPGFVAGGSSALAADIDRALPDAGRAIDEFAALAGELAGRGCRGWPGGGEYLDLLLARVQLVDLDADGLAELGAQRVRDERRRLDEVARRADPDRGWREQIDRIKDDHPQPEDFLQTYRHAMLAAARHTVTADLLSLPDGEQCLMDWVPEYRREGLPLGEMVTSPPYAPNLASRFLLTPADPTATPERRAEHARDNCYTFALSIAGHETYPGHHVQSVHHKLGTPRSSIRRFVHSPQFVEGWGLYVEDLLAETGYRAGDLKMELFTRRNALWRALRMVVDVGLHTGTLSIEQAVDLMVDQAGMDRHMAAGEVRRYTRHDNPTYPSSYMLGRDAFHRVRTEVSTRQGSAFRLRTFHDALLSFGSVPVALVGTMMCAGAPTDAVPEISEGTP